mmetsp:Transcript_11018/g.30947  ORF Transcript_11018/g.30947 Transcript_11018/m.30947 type:complete len:211 (-) Transcript_11018:287-919(-)
MLLVEALRVGPHDLPEGTAVAAPDAGAGRSSADGGVPWAVVEQGETTKGAARANGVHELVVHYDVKLTSVRGKEVKSRLALLNDNLSSRVAEELHGGHYLTHVLLRERGAELVPHDGVSQDLLRGEALAAWPPPRGRPGGLPRKLRALEAEVADAVEHAAGPAGLRVLKDSGQTREVPDDYLLLSVLAASDALPIRIVLPAHVAGASNLG